MNYLPYHLFLFTATCTGYFLYPVQVALNKKKMIREIIRVEITDAATKFLSRKLQIQPVEQ